MTKFIKRDYNRTENDDWILHVQPRLTDYTYSLELRGENGEVLGWQIIGMSE